ncbi:MAG: DNA polymerase III alpha subunit DnaE [Bacteroidetes bacterium HLUCCA01]|nr:MAG: DNA polymerase III alpha subunit DnaE [Bacteroidetes bacterium HLUCCA01]
MPGNSLLTIEYISTVPQFSHLHCHTQYSLLDGAAVIDKLIDKACSCNMPAISITDHGNMFGVPSFVNEAGKKGIKPVIGCEFYVTPTRMADRENKERYHQVLLAKNSTGYKNLVKLTSLGYIEGLYYKPRIDKTVLQEHSEGLIATTCCLASEVNQTILRHGEAEAKKVFEWYLDVFGDDYYIELQRHGLRDQEICNEVLIRWSREYNVKMIATNDSHYVDRQDSEAHDILLALQTNADIHDPKRFRFTDDNNQLSSEFYLKSPEEMAALFQDVPEALDNTNEIVDKTEDIKLSSELLLPHYQVPEGFVTMDDYLRELTYQGAQKKYKELTSEVTERIEMELAIIKKMGFAGYFLIVQGFTTEARNRGVFVGPGRGSAAGSVVAYCIGIINIDPLRYGLLFERFLNPERISPPDIDIDFDDAGRQAVIDYVVEKYGRDNVAQIVTYGTMKAKTAIRDVGRVLGVPLAEVNRIAKLFPEKPGVDTFKHVLNPERNPETYQDIAKLFDAEDQGVRKMMQFARTLEGCARQTGIHAAGVIIAPGNVHDYVPVALSKEKDVITQYDGPNAEYCGLLKMDFLGLKTLSILKTAIQYVRENHDKEYNLDDIPLDDTKTYALYQRGDTVGTFQFESDGMRKYLKELKPTVMDDLIAMNALYRPGPMQFIPQYIECKHGRREVEYPHEDLRVILEPTYGIMVYQEQIMQVARAMGGYSLGEADILRRAMGKKKVEEMEKQKAIFMDRAVNEKGYDKKIAGDVFEKMAFFAGYGFNKSHSAAYSVVAYHTAYFKANYPAEYMAAVLTHNMGDIKKVSSFIEECQHIGIPVDAPNINTGKGQFVVVEGRIQYGMEAIKGVGGNAIAAIVDERTANGEFSSIMDMAARIDLKNCNKKTIESLIQAGAFDTLHANRNQLLESLDDIVLYGQRKQQEEAQNQISLFAEASGGSDLAEPRLREAPMWTSMERLKREREYIGFYLSGHPLDRFNDDTRLFCTHQLGDSLAAAPERANVTVAGIITVARHTRDKKGRPIAFVTIEDEAGTAELLMFSEAYDKFMNLIMVDNLVVVDGTADNASGQPKIIVRNMDRLENLREKNQGRIRLRLRMFTDSLQTDQLRELGNLFSSHKGLTPVAIDVYSSAPAPLRMNVRKFVVDPSDALMKQVRSILGNENVLFEKMDGNR